MSKKRGSTTGTPVFMKYPSPSGDWQYIQIDPKRINPGMLTELYHLEKGPGPGDRSKYRRVLGAEVVANPNLDVSDVLEAVRQMQQQLSDSLEALGPTGEQIRDEFLNEMDLSGMINQIASGQVSAASDSVRTYFWTLVAAFSDIVSKLQALETTVGGMHISVEISSEMAKRAAATALDSAEIAEKLYWEWAEWISELTTSVRNLDSKERFLRERLRPFQSAQMNWQDLTEVDHQTHRDLLDFLRGGDDPFIVVAAERASRDRSELNETIKKAESLISACRSIEKQGQGSWKRFQRDFSQNVEGSKSEIQSICAKLAEATRKVNDFENRFEGDTLRPYQVGDAPAIEKAEYEESKQILSSSKWSPERAKVRILGLITTIQRSLGPCPKLPDDVIAAIDRIEEEIENIRSDWKAEDALVEESVYPVPLPRYSTIPPSPGEEIAIDSDRLQELYELVICVAYVLTCNKKFLARSNMRALLGVIQYLNLCTIAEGKAYRKALEARSTQPGERETYEEKFGQTWAESEATWLYFNPANVEPDQRPKARKLVLKLSQCAGNQARNLMRMKGLDEDQIREARQRRKDDQLEARGSFLGSKSSNGG
jgi:hypothetical protein